MNKGVARILICIENTKLRMQLAHDTRMERLDKLRHPKEKTSNREHNNE